MAAVKYFGYTYIVSIMLIVSILIGRLCWLSARYSQQPAFGARVE